MATPIGIDWPCEECNYRNYASRTTCRQCKSKKAPGKYSMDWPCVSCGYFNYSYRQFCHSCGADGRNTEYKESNDHEDTKRRRLVTKQANHDFVRVEEVSYHQQSSAGSKTVRCSTVTSAKMRPLKSEFSRSGPTDRRSNLTSTIPMDEEQERFRRLPKQVSKVLPADYGPFPPSKETRFKSDASEAFLEGHTSPVLSGGGDNVWNMNATVVSMRKFDKDLRTWMKENERSLDYLDRLQDQMMQRNKLRCEKNHAVDLVIQGNERGSFIPRSKRQKTAAASRKDARSVEVEVIDLESDSDHDLAKEQSNRIEADVRKKLLRDMDGSRKVVEASRQRRFPREVSPDRDRRKDRYYQDYDDDELEPREKRRSQRTRQESSIKAAGDWKFNR